MGGALVLAAASRPTGLCNKSYYIIAAGVAYYGIPNVEQFKPSDLNIPVLGNMAINDHAKGFSDPDTVKAYEKLALEAGKDLKIEYNWYYMEVFMTPSTHSTIRTLLDTMKLLPSRLEKNP